MVDANSVQYVLVEVCRGFRLLKPLQTISDRRNQTKVILEALLFSNDSRDT